MNNLVNKTIAVAATALCLGAGLQAFADSAGDVWSIMQCDENGITTNRFDTTVEYNSDNSIKVTNPIPVKETLYFRIRLWNHCLADSSGAPYYAPWKQTYTDERTASGEELDQASDWATYRPRIAIFTAGSDVPSWAELKDIYNTTDKVGEYFTDLVFQYTVQPGDFGLPIDIAVDNSGTPVPSYTDSGTSYYFDPNRTVWTFKPWDYKNGAFTAENIVWAAGDATGSGTPLPAGAFPADWVEAEKNIEKNAANPGGVSTKGKGTGTNFGTETGFYLQTVRLGGIDADGNITTDTSAFSYSVPMYSTKSVGLIVADNTLLSSRQFYVWSDNEDAFKVAASSGVTIEENVAVDPADASVKRTVATVTLTADTASFALVGVNKEQTGNLVLSATPHYNQMNGGARMSDYITVPVTVTEPEPPSLDVSGAATITANGERWTGTKLKVATTYALPSDSPNDLAVTLTPSIEGGADWKEFVFFSNSETYTGATPPDNGVTGDNVLAGVIKKGTSSLAFDNGTTKEIYVFALKTDAQATVLKVVPSCTGDDGNFLEGRTKEYSATIKSAVEASMAREITPTKNLPVEIPVAVSDAYADEQLAEDYTLMFKTDADDEDESAVVFNGLYLRDGILYTDVSSSPYVLPKVTFENELQTTSAIRVISPVGKADSGWVTFTHAVKKMDVMARVIGEDGQYVNTATVEEGTVLPVTVENPAYKNGDLWAFLVSNDPTEGVESGWFADTSWVVGNDYTDGKGLKVAQGTTLNIGNITPLTQFNATFRVVLCTTETYSEDAVYTAFPSSLFTLNVTNAPASVGGMWMYLTRDVSEQPEDKDEDDDGIFSETILYGQSRAFRAIVSDSSFDKANGMVVKWTVRKVGATKDEKILVTKPDGTTETTSAYYQISTGVDDTVDTDAGLFLPTFIAATNYIVTAEVWDRYDYPGQSDEVYFPGSSIQKMVQVKGLSSVRVTTSFVNGDGDNILMENTTVTPRITVSLGDWSDEIPVTVELTVTPRDGNAGTLLFSSDDIYQTDDSGANIYRHTFRVGDYQPWVLEVDLEELDGVAKSANATKGWDVAAKVITTDEISSRQMPANEYYVEGKLAKTVRIVNVAPLPESFMPTSEENNSYTNLSQGQTIDWGVTDVTTDLTTFWTNKWYGGAKADANGDYPSGTGILVVVWGENVVTTNFFADGLTYGQFAPEFIDEEYSATVYFDFYDKDQSKSIVTAGPYVFPMKPTKKITTVANMPSGGQAFSGISSKYATSKGVGYGHTWISGGEKKFMSAENFYLSWNAGSTTSKETVYAFGYQVNEEDDGGLSVVEGQPRDVWLTQVGSHRRNAEKPAVCYAYPDGMYDSFLYGWIYADEPGGQEGKFEAAVQMGTNETVIAKLMKKFDLPGELNDDGNYTETIVEAVFSREYTQYDQMGDINNDGIPDYYMLFSGWVGGALAEADGEGGELPAINGKNDDEDYYPASPHLGTSTISPGAVSGWATRGQAFNAYREIRGYHEGLNFGMFQFDRAERETYRPIEALKYNGEQLYGRDWISDIQLSDLEKRSLFSRILKRRNALVRELYTTGRFENGDGDDKELEYRIITNLLHVTYYKGLGRGSNITVANENERLFYPDPDYVSGKVSSDIDRIVIDDDTGTNMTLKADAWLRTYTMSGNEQPTMVTNYLGLVAYTNTSKEAGAEGYETYLLPWELYTVDDAELGSWLDREYNDMFHEQQILAKAFINYEWRHFVSAGTWGWTCENRTDPTTDDTDGDGMPDGYEYYMWYSAVVGAGENQLVGCKFNLSDLEDYSTPISSDEIASIYNPNIARSWTKRDTDNDGIYDNEEFLIGTSPVHWDTDRDGLSDLYEVMYNMNPLTTTGGNNADANGDGDFMAFWKADGSDPLGVYEYVYAATDGTYWILNTLYDGYISTNKESMTVTGSGLQVVPFNGGYTLPTEDTANYIERNLRTFTEDAPLEFDPKKTLALHKDKNKVVQTTVSLYHHQVHNYFGFDPRTGWYSGANGTLSTTGRWIQGGPLVCGTPTHTGVYTAINEYLLLKYRYIVGLRSYDDDKAALADGRTTIANIITEGTTNPSADYEGTTWGDDETTYAQNQHGADTDGDAIPDGWELYIGIDPNRAWTIAKGAPGYDALYHDGTAVWPLPIASAAEYSDGLSIVAEYAGTDSCGAYEACETIYANHPSKGSNWYNKFFPTDPRNVDTDGDGIGDGEERGASWSGMFTFNRWGQTVSGLVKHSAIYGNPVDGGSMCIRGGGFNPLTIDTDSDGLPDPWERQYAGVLFHNNDVVEYIEEDGKSSRRVPASLLSGSLYDDLRAEVQAHWGIYTNADDDVYHILMGMDPTYADATSSTATGTADRDWDGDGLQNWQEYMVQAMRHLRYDDSRTPLLGRDCPAVNAATGVYEPGRFNGSSKGYLRTSYITPFTEADTNALTAAGYPNFAKFVAEYPDYLSILGYFADPPKEWDHARADLGNKYMLPPLTVQDMVYEAGYEVQAEDEAGRPIWSYEGSDGATYTGAVEYVNGYYYAPFEYEDVVYMAAVEPLMKPLTMSMAYTYVPKREAVASSIEYVGTDPRLWDTDQDGMDDYYELYHGLNPLLGSIGSTVGEITCDVIAQNTLGVTAWQNAWVGWDNTEYPALDPIKHPWMMGVPECDADGDSLRNYEEAILANATSPGPAHTDPTPAWMTDITVPDGDEFALTENVLVTNYLSDAAGNPVYTIVNGRPVRKYKDIVETVVTNATRAMAKSPSYTALYYVNEIAQSSTTVTQNDDGSITTTTSGLPQIALSWGCYGFDYLASFELNEGYDTDNDWRTDSGEVKSLSRKNSDPIDFSDPVHRQSVWFGGSDDPGALISFSPTRRSMNATDFFKQFTVEAWIRPDAVANGQDQYIVSRASRYGAWDLESWNEYGSASNAVIRMNFALGIDASGHVFAEMQNMTDLSSRATGEKIVDGEWVHVAATYDGTTLRLYRNGALDTSANTTLIPANGTTEVLQDPQDVTRFPYARYHIVPSVTIIGGRACGDGAFAYVYAAAATGWDDVATDFYEGRVAEVRTWDGARTAAEIAAEYNVAYTIDDVKMKRLEFYAAWRDGGSRNDNDDRDMLPAELVQYYNMATLPGATDKSFVRLEPTGFQDNVVGYARNPGNDAQTLGNALKVGWWSSLLDSPVASKVYTSGFVVPWVQNMMAHLPRLSGSVADSVFWSENYAGYTPATFHDLDSYVFPNTMNPYTLALTHYEDEYLRKKYANLVWHSSGILVEDTTVITNNSVAVAHYLQSRYDYRMGFDGTSDLIPVGSAFAKRGDSYWDGQGAETAWQETGTDSNANDLPDWWEARYGLAADATADTEVTRNGVAMSAYEAYIRDLAAGMLPSGSSDTAYLNREDFDSNGLPDWWTDVYGVKGSAADDDDNDGLSNYTEFLLSEYFDLGKTFSPVKAKSVSLYDSDYFFRIGQLYAGEIFTDHDFVEDVWEDEQGGGYANRYSWDASQDSDEDGWSNYAERRFSQFTTSIRAPGVSHIVSETEVKDMPIPTIKLTLRYNGDQPLSGGEGEGSSEAGGDSSEYDNQIANKIGNIVVQTFTKQGIVVPDATYKLAPGTDALRFFNLGASEGGIRQGFLAPGHIKDGDVQLLVMQTANSRVYHWSIYGIRIRKGTYEMFLNDRNRYGTANVTLLQYEPSWTTVDGFSVAQSGNSSQASLTLHGEKIGSLDLETGAFAIDTSKLEGVTDSDGNTIDLAVAQFQFNYISRIPTIQGNKIALYLGEPNTGFVKEGENTIVAFLDLDGDGKFTYGEPMGTTVADVGWYQGAAEIELTDTSAIITRANLLDGYTDRAALYGTEHGDVTNLIAGTLSGGKYERVRVIRTQVNGWGIQTLGMENRVIFDKMINLDQRSYFYEGDVLENGALDIDWDDFQSEVMANRSVTSGKIDPIAVTYRVVLGNGSISAVETNNLYSIATVRHFDVADGRTRPVTQSPGSQVSAVFGSRPVFKWTMKSVKADTGEAVDNNSYTAFKIQVRDGSSVVYDSGIRRVPARDLQGVYTFVPDVYASDLLEPGKNYKWFVSMYNSKFRSDFWSLDENNTFRMNPLTDNFGTIEVAVRYFGPSSVFNAGAIRVEAFETPDFSGDPVARTTLTDRSAVALSDSEHVANAKLVGLETGKYFVRAYIDLNSYGTTRAKDSWESWGYVCKRDASDKDIYTPTTIAVGGNGVNTVFDLYIEDVDTNGNCLPDAWEIVQNRGTLDNGTENLNDTLDAGIEINQSITGNLQNQQLGVPGDGSLSAYVFSVMSNSGVAALILDADTETHSDYTIAAASAVGTITTVAETEKLDVTAIGVDESNVTLKIKGLANVTRSATRGGKTLVGANAMIYTGTGAVNDARIVGKVEYTVDLDNPQWADSGVRVNLTVNDDGSFESDPFDVPKPSADAKQCFYRIIPLN